MAVIGFDVSEENFRKLVSDPAVAAPVEEETKRVRLPPCEYCGAALEAETADVDIGVGVQSHTLGWRCPSGCPFAFACCNGCGVVEVDEKVEHHAWCTEKRTSS